MTIALLKNMNQIPFSSEHQLELERCQLFLKEHPELASTIAYIQFQYHLEKLEECQLLQAKYNDLLFEYKKVLQQNQQLKKENSDLTQLILCLCDRDTPLPDFLQVVIERL